MWGWFMLVFLFFATNDKLKRTQRATGAFLVYFLTVAAFLRIIMVLHQRKASGYCLLSEELYDWITVSLIFAALTWVVMLAILMRYGTEQDYMLHEELLDPSPPEAKRRKDGLSNKYSNVPVLPEISDALSEQERASLIKARDMLERQAQLIRQEAVPCRRRVRTGFAYRAASLYFLADLVWGMYGTILVARGLQHDCLAQTPRMFWLAMLVSVLFVVGAAAVLVALVHRVLNRHISFTNRPTKKVR